MHQCLLAQNFLPLSLSLRRSGLLRRLFADGFLALGCLPSRLGLPLFGLLFFGALSGRLIAGLCLPRRLRPIGLLTLSRLCQRFLPDRFGLRCLRPRRRLASRLLPHRFLPSGFGCGSGVRFSNLRRGRLLQGGLTGGVLHRQQLPGLGGALRCVLPLHFQLRRFGQRSLFAQRLLLGCRSLRQILALGLHACQLHPTGFLARCVGADRLLPLRFNACHRGLRSRVVNGLLGGLFRRPLGSQRTRRHFPCGLGTCGGKLTICRRLQRGLRLCLSTNNLWRHKLFHRFAQDRDRDWLRLRNRRLGAFRRRAVGIAERGGIGRLSTRPRRSQCWRWRWCCVHRGGLGRWLAGLRLGL